VWLGNDPAEAHGGASLFGNIHVTTPKSRHYLVLLVMAKFVHGSGAQRWLIARRVLGRAARLCGLHRAAYLCVDLWHRGTDLVRRAAGRPGRPHCAAWLRATAGLDNRAYLRGWTQRRHAGGPKIVVLAMGSVGDILQITPVLRALRAMCPTAEICLLHRSPAAAMVLEGNGHIDSIGTASADHFAEVTRAVRDHGAADLVVDIASISYIVTYTPAPRALRHPEMRASLPDSFLAAAAAARAPWARHPPVFPRRDPAFAWPAEWAGWHYLDVLGTTGNLPIDRHSALDFATGPDDAAGPTPPRGRYVTVQNGVDATVRKWARVAGMLPTKLLPPATWREAVRLLREAGMSVVQLGAADDEPIAGVDADLRGRTTLRQAAILLRGAACHVGTEGGLVHLARAMQVRSVVAFGPTSRDFLGYPDNVNLIVDDCTGCWWTTKDWFIRCPRGFADPPCMRAHSGDMIASAALAIAEAACQPA
jgi:hypothetical protein